MQNNAKLNLLSSDFPIFDIEAKISKNKGLEDLGFLTFVRTYSKDGEQYEDTVNRYLNFFIDKYPNLKKKIKSYGRAIFDKKVVGSMRLFQFAGYPIDRDNARAYNCSFLGISTFKDFADSLYLLCCGCGVGVSVEKKYIQNLPIISEGRKFRKEILDSKEGWGDSIVDLLENPDIEFDYSFIRAAGSPLSTGGVSSGPEPLKKSHDKIREIVRKKVGSQLSSTDIAEIACLIAECVVAGGVRRSSIIILFNDDEMLNFKNTDKWWETHPHKTLANISRVVLRGSDEVGITINAALDSFSGEPGLMLVEKDTDGENTGCNPCGEISLIDKGFCNLCEIIMPNCKNEEDFYWASEAASFFGTLQASLTDFNYIHPDWAKNAKKEAIIGVSLTGQAMAQHLCKKEILNKGAAIVLATNKIFAQELGINPAKRCTTTKPSGTTSCVFGTSSGIGAIYSEYCIRRVRVSKISDLGQKLMKIQEKQTGNPKFNFIIEDSKKDQKDIVLQFPVHYRGVDSIYRKDETAVELLGRVKNIYDNWILPGHIEGQETNNVSVTVFFHPEEKASVKEWMLNNQDSYRGISVLPYDGGVYVLPPYEEVSKDEWNQYLSQYPDIDWKDFCSVGISSVAESTSACSGGQCELTSF